MEGLREELRGVVFLAACEHGRDEGKEVLRAKSKVTVRTIPFARYDIDIALVETRVVSMAAVWSATRM
jgi:hypothetical protein